MSLTVPEFSRLLSILNQTKLQQTNNALYQFLTNFLQYTKTFSENVGVAIDSNPALSLVNKSFLTAGDPLPELVFGRELLAGENIEFDDSVDNERTVNALGSFVPFFIPDTDTFTVPEFKQALFTMLIDNEGIIVLDGFLVEVD